MKKAAPASTPTPAPSTATAVAAAAVAAPAPAPAPAAVAPPASTVKDAEFSVNGNDLQMKIRVLQARNLKGSKPDKINTMAKVQFADFVLKDSPVVSDSASPQYNFEQSLSLVVDEVGRGETMLSSVLDAILLTSNSLHAWPSTVNLFNNYRSIMIV